MRVKLTMLGSGNAAVTRCYNTCFSLQRGERVWLVDAGGGNGILRRLEQGGVELRNVHDLFVTHAHTDHLLGCVWIIRMVAQAMNSGRYDDALHVWGAGEVLDVLEWICRHTLPGKVCSHLGVDIVMHRLTDGEEFSVLAGLRTQAFDIGSTKALQYGFRMELPDGRILTCLGDEPYNERVRQYALGAHWLMCEAFCLYKDRERFKPYEKHHSTAADAGRIAAELQVENLLLYHTEDKTLETRKVAYAREAAQFFGGRVVVPDDLESLEL